MRYISTRGQAKSLTFSEVLLAGLADDGGLYMPEVWPEISREDLRRFRDLSYSEAATEIIGLFTGSDIPKAVLRNSLNQAYGSFRHKAVAPLYQLSGTDWLLELHHGPTLAFKDIALQWLGVIFDYVLKSKGERRTIIAATSGDTGAAAIHAFKGSDAVDVFILHPKDRLSDVQRRMMTTVNAPNIYNIAIDGNFDDCQAMVKAMFADDGFRRSLKVSAVNSINWARILAQMVYFIISAVALGAPNRALTYVVPTGNFGDIFAGYCAAQIGLPVAMLGIANNDNDLLTDMLSDGQYRARKTIATSSPAMDIGNPGNFERLLFEESGRDDKQIVNWMAALGRGEGFEICPATLQNIKRKFTAASASQEEVAAKMRAIYEDYDLLVDPHTAVALVAMEKLRRSRAIGDSVVTLATAHGAKFPELVKAATGQTPILPASFEGLMGAQEFCTNLANDLDQVKSFIRQHAKPTQPA